MKMIRVVPVLLLWMLGGALNAAHCYFLPFYKGYDFQWHIIPAGAFHGLVLALIPVCLVVALSSRSLFVKILGLFAAGYLSGWISGIFLGFSLEGKWALARLWWPVRYGISLDDTLISPFTFFGLVGTLYFAFLTFSGRPARFSLFSHVVCAAVSGVAGSVWFWAGTKPVYICLIHGLIWGIFTGLGTWMYFKKEIS